MKIINKYIAALLWSASSVLSAQTHATAAPPVPSTGIPGVVVATDYPDLQAAVAALPAPGGTIFLPPGTYRLKKPLDLSNTYNSGDKTRWITLQGSGKMNTIITGDFPDQPLVDATNAGRLTVRDMTFSGNCKTLWLSARRLNGGGGGSAFYNCTFRGDHAEVTIWLIGSECNRFFNCEITNHTKNGVCVAFLPNPQFTARGISYSIESPYVGAEMTGGSTTELRFYGCFIHSFGANSIGLYNQGSTADTSISGGYNHNAGFASIYLDGTKANVGDTAFRDLRIEGEPGLYCLYATGAVRNVTIESGNWGSAGEVIRYEAATEGHAANSGAEGWSISNISLTIQDQSIRNPEKAGASFTLPRDQRALIRLDRMDNCRIENIWTVAYEIVRAPKVDTKPDNKDYGTVIQNQAFTSEDKLEYFTPKFLICSDWARESTIQAATADSVVLPANSLGNRLECLADDGGAARRTYLAGGNRPDLLNLAPVDVRKIKSPRVGDLAMDSGTLQGDGQPCLAFFDGKTWRPCGVGAGGSD